jgi:hypothetical protein
MAMRRSPCAKDDKTRQKAEGTLVPDAVKYCAIFGLLASSVLYLKFLIMIYSLYRRGFIVTIPIRLILYISFIAPIISPPNPSVFFYWKEISILFKIPVFPPSFYNNKLNTNLTDP